MVAAINEIPIVSWQRAERHAVWVDERSLTPCEARFRRSLLPHERLDWRRAFAAKRLQDPGHREHEVRLGLGVQEILERLDRTARHRGRKREHSGGTPKPHWRIVNDPPAPGINLDGLPSAVAEIKVDLVADVGDAHVHFPCRAIDSCLSFENAQGRVQSLCVRSATSFQVVAARQPASKAFGADRPSLAVVVDVDIRISLYRPVRGRDLPLPQARSRRRIASWPSPLNRR